VPAVASSAIPAVLEKLGPLDADRIADLGPYLESVPDPRSRRGRRYSLTAILLMCACAAVCGAKIIDELAEFGERATNSLLASLGVRRHRLGWRRSPKPVTLGRVLQALDGDALDQAVGAYLADRHRITASADVTDTRSRQVIAVPRQDTQELSPPGRAAAPPALGGHPRPRRHDRPGRSRRKDQRSGVFKVERRGCVRGLGGW
jgi:hypothetical protein